MKKIAAYTFLAIIISCGASFAQKVDSVSIKKDSTKKTDYFSKYKTKPVSKGTSSGVNESWNKKTATKKVESKYNVENGRVVGGETTIKLGKKNQ